LFTFGLTHHFWTADFGPEAKCKPGYLEITVKKMRDQNKILEKQQQILDSIRQRLKEPLLFRDTATTQ
jgi:hypothetical protein